MAKPYELVSFLIIIVFSIGLLGCSDNEQDPIAKSQNPLSAESTNGIASVIPSTSTPFSMELLPIYKDAMSIKVTSPVTSNVSSMGTTIITTFNSPTDFDTVSRFYFTTLKNQGWVPIQQLFGYPTPDLDNSYAKIPNGYLWADPTGNSPWRLYLLLTTSKSQTPGSMTSYELDLERWPILGKIPTYPGSTLISDRNEAISVSRPYTEHISVYQVKAPTQMVDAYYKANMVTYGWPISVDGRHYYFRYNYGDVSPIALNVDIDINSDSSSSTLIEIRSHGIDALDSLRQRVK